MESINIKQCSKCGSFDTYIYHRRDRGNRRYECWHHDGIGGFLCNKCNKKKYNHEHVEQIKEYEERTQRKKKRIQFGGVGGRQINLPFNPRKYKCQRCKKKFKRTLICRLEGHRNKWDFEFNPLGFIRELCQGCANREGYCGYPARKLREE